MRRVTIRKTKTLPIRRPALLLAVALGLALAASVPAVAQVIEEEDLKEKELETAPRFTAPKDDAELEILFRAAEDAFFDAVDAEAALAEIDRALDAIEERRRTGELGDAVRGLLVRGLAYRAELRLELDDAAGADEDLGRILELDPRARLDEQAVSADLVERFERIRKERVGALRVTAVPPDLELSIDGRPIALERPGTGAATDDEAGGEPRGALDAEDDEDAPPPETVVSLLAGIRLVEASRAGYAPLAREVEVTAGKETPLAVELERVSAVVRLHTRPAEAEVTLDGVPYGVTAGVAGEGFAADTLGRYRREEFSSEFLVPDVEPGLRVLEVRKEGYRPYRAELRVSELGDYDMPPIVLEEQRGTLVLRDLPSDAELTIDGRETQGESRSAASARISLPPGEHHVQATQGATRMFSTRVRLADRQTIEVNVRLRPGLAFLGVLGARGDDLARALRLGLGQSERWSLLDRSPEAREVLPKAGLTVESARRAAAGDAGAVDWTRVQTAVDARAPGLLYLAAVVADDLLASEADVWIWAAAPGPARPDRLRIDLGRPAEIERLAGYFHRTLPLRRPWLGALVISSGASPHPVIAHLTPGGPLATAGAEVGDQLVAVARVPVFSGADVEARLLAAETGETVDVGLQTPEGTRNVQVTLGSSPRLYSRPVPDLPDAIAFTELLLADERARPAERWVVRLNQALVLLRADDHEGAVRLLRDVAAPEDPDGAGRATVDYWLGVALAGAGGSYREAAVEAFRRAAGVPGARLDHHDGPWVAPRARARLSMLGGG